MKASRSTNPPNSQEYAITSAAQRLTLLEDTLLSMESVLVAYSGGVDSTFLIKVASYVLKHKVIAVTSISPVSISRELTEGYRNAERFGVKHMVINTNQLKNPYFRSNNLDRCYHCKRELWLNLSELARQYGLNYVVDGSNSDDEFDFRPGMEASLEFGIRSPIKQSGLTKIDIRELSKEMGVSTWNMPSSACLASRIPYGTEITMKKLQRIEQAEEFLINLGFAQVRVRDHDSTARIEVARQDMNILLDEEMAQKISNELQALGYTYVTLDLQGYRTGSLNEVLV